MLKRVPLRRNSEQVSGSPCDKFRCETCHDLGWLWEDRLVRCDCKKEEDEKRRQQIFLKQCALPAGAEHMTFEHFEVRWGLEKAHDAALQLAENREIIWLTLVGGVDMGKTHLAVAICRRWLAGGRLARYAFVPLLLDDLRNAYRPGAEISYEQEFHFLCEVPLLVLDDLGAESATAWAQEKLDTLIDYRYIHRFPLVVTTNLPLDKLSARIASRLQRIQGGKVIVLDAPEYRLRKTDTEVKDGRQ